MKEMPVVTIYDVGLHQRPAKCLVGKHIYSDDRCQGPNGGDRTGTHRIKNLGITVSWPGSRANGISGTYERVNHVVGSYN